MRVDWAIPCKYAEVNGTLATIVGAQVDSVRVAEFPIRLSTFVALRLVFDDSEASDQHEVHFKMLDPLLVQIGERRATVMLGAPNPDKQPGWEAHHLMALNLHFEATQPGTHTFELYLNERHQHTLPFSVRAVVDQLA
ncbi:MAG: DUF6941 family protein [Thermoleophilaceae bacterium]